MASEAGEPAILVVEILSERANQHHLGVVPWVASPLFVARPDTERGPGLSAAGSSAATHDLCARDAETEEILGKFDTVQRPANVFRRGYQAWVTPLKLKKYRCRHSLERRSGALAVIPQDGGHQSVMKLLQRETDLPY